MEDSIGDKRKRNLCRQALPLTYTKHEGLAVAGPPLKHTLTNIKRSEYLTVKFSFDYLCKYT